MISSSGVGVKMDFIKLILLRLLEISLVAIFQNKFWGCRMYKRNRSFIKKALVTIST